MKRYAIPVLGLLVLGFTLEWCVYAGDDIDAEEAKALVAEQKILPLEKILTIAQGYKPGRLLDTELEREHGSYVYELELIDNKGRVWELELDAVNGELLELERED